ncbi:MAG: M12 family metallo-peptidase [Planctomycetota bacterium]
MWVAICATGAWACSSGGGDGDDAAPPPPTTVAFTTSAVDHSEGGGALNVDVRLSTTLAELTADLTVDVVDRGTGTATSASDYFAFAPVTVTFPTGSVSGDIQTVSLTAIDDSLAEGANETVVLGLQDVSGGALGGATTQTVTLLEIDTAAVAFQAATTLTPDETANSYVAAVELDLSPGASLGFDIDLIVSDDGTGSATSGADYASINPVSVQFSAGTASGTTRDVTIQVLDDTDLEGPETVAVHLTGPSMTEVITTGILRHVLTITDDEAPPAPAFVATHGPTGTETPLAYNDAIDLGTQTNDTGPNAGTLLVIANQGGGPMQLGNPVLSGANASDFSLEIQSATSPGASVAATSAPAEMVDLGAPFVRMAASTVPGDASDVVRPGIAVAIDYASLGDLAHVDRARLHGFPLPDLGDVTLELERVPLPIADDAVLMVDGEVVAGGPRALLRDLSTWSGTAVEIPDSRVFLSMTEDGPQGFVELPFDEGRFIHLSPETAASASSPATCRLVHESDLVALAGDVRPPLCAGVEDVPGQTLDLGHDLPGLASNAPPIGETVVAPNCRIAIETDYQFFQDLGSASALTDYVTGLVAATSDTYFEHVQTTLSIAYLGIHTTAADPWTTPDGGGSTSAMLSEFRSAWNSSGWPASADLAHFLSGANLGGGIAYVNVLCSQSFGYGVSANLRGNINWGTWNGTNGSFTWDFVVFAHELGHNFGTGHTHDYCPPIDQCSSNCNGTTTCSQGTIMSYCHTCGGMDNIDIAFHPEVSNLMRQRVDSSCLGDAAMAAGDAVTYRLQFWPRSGTGAKSATITFDHDASNVNDPFVLTVTGTSQ